MINEPLVETYVILGKKGDNKITYLNKILSSISSKTIKFEMNILFETQYDFQFEALLKQEIAFLEYKNESLIVYNKNKLRDIVGNYNQFINYIIRTFSYIEKTKLEDYEEQTLDQYRHFLNTNKNKFAFFEIKIGDKVIQEKIVFELFNQVCPKTVENFLALCRGDSTNKKNEKLSYEKTYFSRIVKNGFIQGGDLSQLKICNYNF